MRGVLLAMILLVPPAAAELAPERAQELFHEAGELFREANQTRSTNPSQAYTLYQAAALRYERIVREGEAANGRLYYNLGNTYAQMDELGRAILNYRRAERYIPGDRDLAQSLGYARSRRLDRFDRSTETRVLETLFFWHYDLSSRFRSWLFLGCWLGFWALAALRLLRPERISRLAPAGVGLAAALLAGSLGYQGWLESHERHGVVVAPESVARKGDGASYEPAFMEPLHSGAEFKLLENRAGWLHVELPGGRTAWLAASDAELVESES